ncbi:hypothetical protein A8135_09995 [Legionella jamestowniensis]|uniref:Oxidoreductase n=1 Tax=Legionella jamestowniensis TaxID=455 RepID=A0ABX2XWN5_9GAMM|nr:Dot/Icm T4SS effector PI-3-phosphatase SidP [Legionella jamestowniensis]OCH99063.1 hypothetical protein A8135_09995 [Legionella jamestowniensis]
MGKKTILRLAEGTKFPGFENELKEETAHLQKKPKLPSLLEENLKKIIGDFEVEYYPTVPDLKCSYQRRIDSLHQSFLYILDTIPAFTTKRRALEDYLLWCKSLCLLPEGEPIDKYQEILAKYTGLLVNALTDYYPYAVGSRDKIKLATELLNKAEQYVIMKEGRASIATLIPLKINDKTEYVLRWERPLAPYLPETFQEFNAIKQERLITTPVWFRELPYLMQIYLHSCIPQYVVIESNEETLSKLKFALNQFMLKWAEIKNYRSLTNDLEAIRGNKFPTWFTGLPRHDQQLLKLFFDSKLNIQEIDSQLKEFSDKIQSWTVEATKAPAKNSHFNAQELEVLKKLPYWFVVLEEYEQQFLKKALDSHELLEDAISFVPSRQRRIPLTANLCESNCLTLTEKGEVVKRYPSRTRSSHLASRDVIKLPPQVKKLHASRNLARIISTAEAKQPILIQTLISPVKLLDGLIPDYYLDQERQETISHFQKETNRIILSTNHPLNMAKYLYYTQANDPACMAIYNMVQIILLVNKVQELDLSWDLKKIEQIVAQAFTEVEYKHENKETSYFSLEMDAKSELVRKNMVALFSENYPLLKSFPGWQQLLSQHLHLRKVYTEKEELDSYLANLLDLQMLVEEYHAVLNSSYGTATVFDYHGRELFLASLENLIFMKAEGKATSTCVSGKDREEIETEDIFAKELYRDQKGRWSSLKDEGHERADFVEFVATLVVSGHGDKLAGQNAPGSDGIKTPEKYWPADIAEAIRKKAGEHALRNSDILATNNEVGRIGDLPRLVKPRFAECMLASLKLSSELRQAILNELAILCGEQKFLSNRTWKLPFISSPAPKGFEKIKPILGCPGNDDAAHAYKLAQIIFEIKQRPRESWTRAPAIQKLYQALLDLCEEESQEKAQHTISLLVKTKFMAFNENSVYSQ